MGPTGWWRPGSAHGREAEFAGPDRAGDGTMTRHPPSNVLAAVLAVVLALGCAWTARYSEAADADGRLQTASLQRGALVFRQQCQQCHPGGPDTVATGSDGRPLPPALLALQVRRGFGRMPAVPATTLDDGALTALVDFLMARHAARAAAPPPP